MNDVICLATGKTYELVVQTMVTAHPACAPFPRSYPDYMVPIKKGGIVENLYFIRSIIECFPEEIYSYKHSLPEELYSRLVTYHETRKNGFGYGKPNTKYRFYICEKANDIDASFRVKNIQVAKRMRMDDLPLLR